MRIKKSILAVALGFSLVAGFAQVPTAGAVVEWELVDENLSLGMNGVSPHVEKTANGDRVWRSDGPTGTAVSLCSEAGSCTAESLTTTGGGPVNDFSVAQTPSGLRAYFKRIEPQTNTQAVYSAPCVTADCLSIGAVTLTSSAMQVSKDQKAWGVPDPVRMPDGRIRIYIVESPVEGKCTEKIASYISSDGISFTKEAGWRLEGGFVDTEVLRAKDGDWVMVMADGPGCGDRVQKLYMSTSNDGLTWAKPQRISGSDLRRLDPTGYEVSANVFRVYYATATAGVLGDVTYTIKRGTIAIKQSSSDVAVTGGKNKSAKTTITCVKGKTTKKVTGVNPKCPSGFKKK